MSYPFDEKSKETPVAPQPIILSPAPSIDELKVKYEKLYNITTSLSDDDDSHTEVAFFFKKPTAISYDRFVKTASTSASKASRAFVLDAVIEEHHQRLMDTLDEYPAMVLSICDKLMALLGLSQETTVKKL